MPARTPHKTQAPLIKPSYRAAIAWLAANDDNDWLEDEAPILSVPAALVADLFGAESGRVINSLKRAINNTRKDAQNA